MTGDRLRVAICAAGEIWGGVEQFVETLASGLAADGPAPVVILFHDGELASRLRRLGLPVVVVDAGKYHPALIAGLRGTLRRHRIDVLHVHGYKATVVGTLAARATGIRIVKTEHGRLERLARWSDLASYARMAMNVSLDRLATRAAVDAIAFVSGDIQRPTASIGRVIYNGIHPCAGSAGIPAWATREHFHLGIVGRLDAVKGHAHLFDALERMTGLSQVRAHVFGAGPLDGYLQERCARGPLASIVRFHGFQAPIEPHIRALDLLVMPSLHEGLPYALLEAMQLGVPVIASRVGGLVEALGDDCGELIPPRDVGALARAIEGLRRDPERRAALVRRARARVSERFCAAAMVRGYAELYREAWSTAS